MWIIDGELLFIWFLFVLMLHFRGCISTHSFSSFFGCSILFSKPFFSSSGYNKCLKKRAKTSERWAPTVYYKNTRNLSQYWTQYNSKQYFFALPPLNIAGSHESQWDELHHKEGKLITINLIFNLKCKSMLNILNAWDIEYYHLKQHFVFLIEFNLNCAKMFAIRPFKFIWII